MVHSPSPIRLGHLASHRNWNGRRAFTARLPWLWPLVTVELLLVLTGHSRGKLYAAHHTALCNIPPDLLNRFLLR